MGNLKKMANQEEKLVRANQRLTIEILNKHIKTISNFSDEEMARVKDAILADLLKVAPEATKKGLKLGVDFINEAL